MATTADSHPDSDSARRVPVERRRLPAAPLLEVIATHARRRHQSLEELLGDHDSRNPWLLQALRRAEASGEITVQTGEHLCDLLGWHPRMVWGEVYERTIAEPPHTATAPAGTPTAYRQGCRCLDCREANRAAIARSRRDSPKAGERLA